MTSRDPGQRVEVAAFSAPATTLEWVGGEQDEEQEAAADQAQRSEHARATIVSGSSRERQRPGKPPRSASGSTATASPRGHPRRRRRGIRWEAARIGVLGNVDHRKSLATKACVRQAKEISDEHRQRGGSRAGDGDPGLAVGVGADHRQGAEDQRNQRSGMRRNGRVRESWSVTSPLGLGRGR